MSDLFKWSDAQISWTGAEHVLEVPHRLAGRAAKHLERGLDEWLRENGHYAVTVVKAAHKIVNVSHTGHVDLSGPDLLEIPARDLRRALGEIAAQAEERGRREDAEDLERMTAWRAALQDDAVDIF